jgi:hypothetical protein
METTIRANDLQLVCVAAKARRLLGTCQLCALSEHPAIEISCRDHSRGYSAGYVERAKRYGLSPARVQPMKRGDIGRVYERVQREHGRREVVKTWGVGIRALQAEPLYVLNGNAA